MKSFCTFYLFLLFIYHLAMFDSILAEKQRLKGELTESFLLLSVPFIPLISRYFSKTLAEVADLSAAAMKWLKQRLAAPIKDLTKK
jgi:hypothetical protein